MKITDIKTAVVHVKMNSKPHYLYHYVRVYTDEGIYGTGEASHVDHGWRDSTRDMARMIIGMDPRDVDACFEFFKAAWYHARAIEEGYFFKEHVNGEPVGAGARSGKESDGENVVGINRADQTYSDHCDRNQVCRKAFIHLMSLVG